MQRNDSKRYTKNERKGDDESIQLTILSWRCKPMEQEPRKNPARQIAANRHT